MIKKLNTDPTQSVATNHCMINKINEVVDVVNQLVLCEQARTCYELIHKNEVPADPYAEQRKWIGKLCKVYDDNDFIHYAVLEEIFDNSNYCYGTQLGNYRHCEPVEPDDNIIYKGGDND